MSTPLPTHLTLLPVPLMCSWHTLVGTDGKRLAGSDAMWQQLDEWHKEFEEAGRQVASRTQPTPPVPKNLEKHGAYPSATAPALLAAAAAAADHEGVQKKDRDAKKQVCVRCVPG